MLGVFRHNRQVHILSSPEESAAAAESGGIDLFLGSLPVALFTSVSLNIRLKWEKLHVCALRKILQEEVVC